jgi:hypothetical protein
LRPRLEALEDRCLPTFSIPVDIGVGLAPGAAAAADYNNDGRLDLAAANSGDNTVSVLLGNGNGAFQQALTSGTGAGPNRFWLWS